MNRLLSLTGAAITTFAMGINANAYAIPSTLDQSLQQVLLDTVAAPDLQAGNPSIPEIESVLTNTTTNLSESVTQKSPEVIKPQLEQSFGKLPIHFEPNQGQVDDAVKFTARGPGYTLFLTGTEAVFSLATPRKKTEQMESPDYFNHEEKLSEPERPQILRMQLGGETLNKKPTVTGLEKQQGVSNYILGNDKNKWRSGVPHYNKVKYEDVYPGIDLVYYGNPQQLEYDFVVEPGADPDQIQLAFDGAENIQISDNGNLNITVADREMLLRAPVIYQIKNGIREDVAGSYIIKTGRPRVAAKSKKTTQISFQLAKYNLTIPLIIDPVVEYSTYLGGSGSDFGRDIAVDADGNVYVTGHTVSNDFPSGNADMVSHGASYDVFVSRLDSAGQLAYSTFLVGSQTDIGFGLEVDFAGSIYITGSTRSDDFPTVNAAYPTINSASVTVGDKSDAFVTRLDTSGIPLYSTFLGGSEDDYANSIGIDANGNAYVCGSTQSNNFPAFNTQNGFLSGDKDIFVTRIDGSGQIAYSTYVGGSGSDNGIDIAVEAEGNIFLTGSTTSTDFPGVEENSLSGHLDAYVAHLNSAGSLVFSKYLGGSDQDVGNAITVDLQGGVYVAGVTYSNDFPILNAAFENFAGFHSAFVTHLDSLGEPVYSTYLGGSWRDSAAGIDVDANGNVYVTGTTFSSNFPAINAFDTGLGGDRDAFVMSLDTSGQTVYSSYLGGAEFENGLDIVTDLVGNAYITGYTTSSDFLTVNAAFDAIAGQSDVFITKLSATGNHPPIAYPKTVTVNENSGIAIVLTGTDPDADTLNYTVVTQPGNGSLSGTAPFLTYLPDADFHGTDSFTFMVDDGMSDSAIATVTIQVNPVNDPPIADFNVDFVTGVPPFIINFDASSSSDDGEIVRYQWDAFRGGLSSGEQVSYSYDRIGNFLIKLTVTDDQGAVSTKESSVVIRGLGSYLRNLLPDQTAVMPAIIKGYATSMIGIDRVQIEIQDNVTGLWWTGTEWGERIEHSAAITETINEETDWEYIFNLGGNNGSGNYRLFTTAVDVNGEQEPTPRETNFTTTDDPNYLLEVIVETPIYDQLLTLPVILSGSATSPMAVESVVIGIYDQRTGKWWNGESWGDWQLNPALSSAVNNNLHNWEYNFNPTGSGGSGVYRAYVRVNDITGAVSRSAQVPFKAFGDTIIPLESIIDTPEPDEVIILPHNLTGTASAPEGVRDVLIGIKDTANGLWWTGSGWGDWILHSATIDQVGTTSVNWQYGFDPSDTNGSGDYRIHTRAVEVRGLREPESTQLNFTGLDSGNLTLDTLIDIPVRNQLLPLPVDLSGTAISPVGIDTVLVGIRDTVNDLWWNGSTWGDWQLNPTPVTPVNGNLVSWNYNFDPTTNGGSGQYRAYVRARDIHGVLADSIQVQFQAYDASGVAFESIIHAPTLNQVTNLPLTIDGAATAPTGVSSVLLGIRDEVSKLWWNGSNWGEWILMSVNTVQVDSTSANWSYDFDPSGSTHSGKLRVYTRAVDMNNVRSESAQVSFTVTP